MDCGFDIDSATIAWSFYYLDEQNIAYPRKCKENKILRGIKDMLETEVNTVDKLNIVWPVPFDRHHGASYKPFVNTLLHLYIAASDTK